MNKFLKYIFLIVVVPSVMGTRKSEHQAWIRINLLGYLPLSQKNAVWCSKDEINLKTFQIINAVTKKIAFSASVGKPFGTYGPFKQTYRLNFSKFSKPGTYYLQAGGARSPEFSISDSVYNGTADFCLRYMRQQRSFFNPYLKDSCHTHDGYALYGPMKDSTFVDVGGGWHDASDYLQYASTSANATYHLLLSYHDFAPVFSDQHLANGLDGSNGTADVLDEARWGLDWLLKMHPKEDWMFNQIGDDRDHINMRIPSQDTQYRKGFERPVYFNSGEPQGAFKYKNRTKGTSSTAGKFASAFALGAEVYKSKDQALSQLYLSKAHSAYRYAGMKPGATQTAPGRAPYFYEEDNWVDDMELAAAELSATEDAANKIRLQREAMDFASREPVTPWLGQDTAKHYQWYPFINLGHNRLAQLTKGSSRDTILAYYKEGIEKVAIKAEKNAFSRGVPFIWCSNNLTTSFAIQCYWYRMLSGDLKFEALEQSNLDWLLGCNPWGTSMVYGLPSNGDTPTDPHSAFTHLKNYPIDGGLVDGPVYGSIFGSLKGITLYNGDEYAQFQSDVAVYHDDYGDYSTNEPTMDGTASLIYLLASREAATRVPGATYSYGGIIRGDTTLRRIALAFSAHEYKEGGSFVREQLRKQAVHASFFFTGDFYRSAENKSLITALKKDGHFLGPHGDKHLLYNDWTSRHLLVSKDSFMNDLNANLKAMAAAGINRPEYFLPSYEWYDRQVAAWTKAAGLQLVSFTPGTLSTADYTLDTAKNYRGSEQILSSILKYESARSTGLNGFILLMHLGAGPGRKDKFYKLLPQLIGALKAKGYEFVGVDELFGGHPD